MSSNKIESNDWKAFLVEANRVSKQKIQRIEANPENVENGLVKLVLGLVEVIRELIEKQAMRKMEHETLSEEELERLGLTLMRLEEKMEELKAHFHLSDEDLKLDLGQIQDIS